MTIITLALLLSAGPASASCCLSSSHIAIQSPGLIGAFSASEKQFMKLALSKLTHSAISSEPRDFFALASEHSAIYSEVSVKPSSGTLKDLLNGDLLFMGMPVESGDAMWTYASTVGIEFKKDGWGSLMQRKAVNNFRGILKDSFNNRPGLLYWRRGVQPGTFDLSGFPESRQSWKITFSSKSATGIIVRIKIYNGHHHADSGSEDFEPA